MVRTAGIKSTLNWLRIRIVILHIIGENHELGDVGKTFKLWVLKATTDALTLCNNSVSIIRFFHLNKNQWHTINQQSDVRAKLFIAINAG